VIAFERSDGLMSKLTRGSVCTGRLMSDCQWLGFALHLIFFPDVSILWSLIHHRPSRRCLRCRLREEAAQIHATE
jgi:hypothetical protein